MGGLIKEIFNKEYEKNQIGFVTIMPCYDKKVESARK